MYYALNGYDRDTKMPEANLMMCFTLNGINKFTHNDFAEMLFFFSFSSEEYTERVTNDLNL